VLLVLGLLACGGGGGPDTSVKVPTLTLSLVDSTEAVVPDRSLSSSDPRYIKVVLRTKSGAAATFTSFSITLGTANAKNTNYTQADIAQSLAPLSAKLKDVTFLAHYGRTNVANSSNLDYNDMNIGLGYALPKDWSINAKYYTNSSMTSTFQNANNVNGQKLYKNAVVATLTKTFE
jgi:hypothetical protein